jgi:hypothetical protein
MNLNRIFMDIYIWIFMAFGFGELWILLDTSNHQQSGWLNTKHYGTVHILWVHCCPIF